MIDYGKPPGNQSQMQIPGFSDSGQELMEEARRWRSANHIPAWQYYMAAARKCCEGGAEASPNWVLQSVRHEFKVSVRNALAAPLARIAMEEDPSLRFRLAKSKVDGFTEAVL